MINKTTFLFILIISIFIFLFSLDVNAKEYELTPSQYHFTRIINGLPGVVSTTWESPISLYVKASSKAVGSPANPQKAKTLADILALRGRTALRQPFCVHIYQKKGQDLARSCVF